LLTEQSLINGSLNPPTEATIKEGMSLAFLFSTAEKAQAPYRQPHVFSRVEIALWKASQRKNECLGIADETKQSYAKQ
jgi:hypothetical protein